MRYQMARPNNNAETATGSQGNFNPLANPAKSRTAAPLATKAGQRQTDWPLARRNKVRTINTVGTERASMMAVSAKAAGQDQPANMANVAGSQAKAAAPVNSASPARFSPRTSNQTKANPANPTGNRETQGRQPVEEKP